jgi:hypothetical protein
MERATKLSRYLVKLFYLLLFILPLVTIGMWLFINHPTVHSLMNAGYLVDPTQSINLPGEIRPLSEVTFSPLVKTLGILASLLAITPLLLGLCVFIKLFKNYQAEIFFSSDNTNCFRRLGALFIINALVVRPLSDMLLTLALTLQNPPGHRYIIVGFGTPNLKYILIGLMILIIASIMHKAQLMQEEQKLII